MWQFNATCKACEQRVANEQRNEDRPLAIIERRAAVHAQKAGVPFDFFWIEMNYRALVPVLRAMMGPEGRCMSCGHEFLNERDIQIEHRFPPRNRQDWARLHARNLWLLCASCNQVKGSKDPAPWLDEQEMVRIANNDEAIARIAREQRAAEASRPVQGSFWT